MQIDVSKIYELSLKEKKTELERFLKLSEECGELAEEILIARDASGFAYKKTSGDGIKGEAVDVILVALSIFFSSGGNLTELSDLLEKKSNKWQQYQKK